MKLTSIFATSLLLSAATLANADITIPFLGDPANVKGITWQKDKNGNLSTRYDDFEKHKATIALPDKKILSLPVGQTSIQTRDGWINDITLGHGYDPLPFKDATAYIDSVLTSNKIEMTEDFKKKWTDYKTAAKADQNFYGDLPISNYVKAVAEVSIYQGKVKSTISFRCAVDFKETALPAGAIELNISAAAAFSPDEKILTSARLFIDAATGKELGKVELPNQYSLSRPVFSSDGKILAVGYTNKIFFLDPAQYKITDTLDVPMSDPKKEGGVVVIGFSPDASKLYIKNPDGIHEWSIADKKIARTFDAVPWEITSLGFSHNGKLIAASHLHGERSVALFDTATGKISATLKPTAKYAVLEYATYQNFDYLEFSANDSQLIASGFMGALSSVWQLPGGQNSCIFNQGGENLSLSPDGKYLLTTTFNTMAGPGAVRVLDAKTQQLTAIARPISGTTSTAFWSPKGTYVIAYASNRTLLFKTADLLKAKPALFKP